MACSVAIGRIGRIDSRRKGNIEMNAKIWCGVLKSLD
jgi:hypothetical protein